MFSFGGEGVSEWGKRMTEWGRSLGFVQRTVSKIKK
jgi:hypothetical protein